MNLAAAWTLLEAEHSRGVGLVTRRLDSAAPYGILAGVEHPANVRALVLEVPAEAIGPAPWPRARGFEVLPVAISPGPKGTVQLQLRCVDRAWSDVFSALSSDLVNRLEKEPSAAAAVISLRKRLSIWHAFFQRGANGLSAQQQRGLFGEVWCLQNLLIKAWGAERAVDSWQGPYGAAHDFRGPEVALEVKATLMEAASAMKISNEHQLASDAVRRLFLCQVVLALHEAGQKSLPDLVREVSSQLGQVDPTVMAEFEDRLQASGYLHLEAAKYPERYSVPSYALYRVIEGFPRLTPADLAEGIETVTYVLRTSSLTTFKLADAELAAALGA
jgi:Putative  PD-(D/E)XK family member, (DUF4420)